MRYERLKKSPSWSPTSSPTTSRSLDKSRPFPLQAKPHSELSLTQEDIENEAFQQHKHEATGLEVQAEYGTLTPEGQQRLTVLQAKMADFWQKKESSQGSGINLLEIPNLFAPRQPSAAQPIQPKLTIGEPGDKYEQEADQVAAQVVNQINAPQKQPLSQGGTLQREEMQGEDEEIKMKPLVQQNGTQTTNESQETRSSVSSIQRTELDTKLHIQRLIDGKSNVSYFENRAFYKELDEVKKSYFDAWLRRAEDFKLSDFLKEVDLIALKAPMQIVAGKRKNPEKAGEETKQNDTTENSGNKGSKTTEALEGSTTSTEDGKSSNAKVSIIIPIKLSEINELVQNTKPDLRKQKTVNEYAFNLVNELEKQKRIKDVWEGEKIYKQIREIAEPLYFTSSKVKKSGFEINGEACKEEELISWIQSKLPENGHGNISGCINDIVLGRGKATTGHSNVLHASAGKKDANGGCTLFFERNEASTAFGNVVGVGQHKTNTSYTIYAGQERFGNVLSL